MQSNFRSLLLLLALGAPAISASAQGKTAAKPATATPAAPAPASATSLVTSGPRGEQFILGADDVIGVDVANHPEMSADALTLSSTGRVALPILGPLTVKGKTLEQARVAIANAFKSQLKNPKVSITLVRARPRQTTVLGDAIARPGAVDLQPGWRVSEVLAAAGGLKDVAPEDVRATLKRVNGAPVALDLATIYRAPEKAANPRVAVGDVLSVVAVPLVNVTVNGDVGTPGPLAVRKAPTLLGAIGRAGDFKFKPEDTDITLLRGGKIITLDAAAASAAPDGAANIKLQDGDLLSVQGVRLNVNVVSDENLVKAPGNYQLDGRSGFMRAISAAGGFAVPINRVSASVRRGNQIIPVDLERAVFDTKADIALQNNDIVWVKPLDGPRVQLTGEVKTPGTYSFKAGTKVLEAVLQAGDLNNLAPEATRITILRTLPDGSQIPFQVDAGRLWGGKDVSQNATLQNGDIVLVNAINTRSISVIGAVEKPGAYELKPGDGLTEAILHADGPSGLAALNRVAIDRRDGTSQIVDYSGLGKGQVKNVTLEAGDTVRVPVNPNQVMMMEAVVKPGYYGIPDDKGLTLAEALNNAGGSVGGAKTNEIAVIRAVPKTPQNPDGYTAIRVKLDKARSGDVGQTLNLPLQAGDVVFVPQGKVTKSGLETATTALGVFRILQGL